MKKGQMVRISNDLYATNVSYGVSPEMKKMKNGVYKVEGVNDLLVLIRDPESKRNWFFRTCDVRSTIITRADAPEPDPVMFTFDPKHIDKGNL